MTARHPRPAAVLVAAALGFAACADGDGSGGGDGAGSSSTVSAPTSSTAGTAPSTGVVGPTTVTTPRVITVTVSAGQVEGGARREQVPLGQPLVLRIVSDTADEVRVDGYEGVTADVPAGGTARLTFTPDRAGVFSVELVEDRLKLLELEVR
ncbi:MAG: hypothetical protein ACRDZ7_05370 [Acidimicrobiia bacterium]